MPKRRQSQKPASKLIEAIHFLESVSAKIHGVLDESKIYKTVRDEFGSSGRRDATILLLTEDGCGLRLAETSLSLAKTTRKNRRRACPPSFRRSILPRVAQPRLKGRKVALSKARILSRVVKDGKTVWVKFSEAVSEWFPASVATRILKSISSDTQSIVTPLKGRGDIMGVLAVSGLALSEPVVPSVERLAQHISTALELARDHADRKRVEEELRSSREQLRSLSGYLQSVREEERTHIAREMHDELGQTLTALKIDLSGLRAELPEEGKELVKKMDSTLALTDSTIQTVKRISAELRPRLLDTLGLAAAMEWQAREFENRTGIVCLVTIGPEDIVHDKELSTAVFRIFQESLTNVARHANATRVEVSLRQRGGSLRLEVADNGKGITHGQASGGKSFGLLGMRERVRYLGGEVEVKGIEGEGTTVGVTIPIVEPAERRLATTPRLVGREKEMRRLKALLKRAEQEEGKLVLVRGEAGVGKTRLVTEFGQDLETRGGRVLWGNCREDTRSIAYYPFREAFNRFLEVRKEEALSVFEGLPDYVRWELGRAVPGLRGTEPSEFEPAKDHFRLFEAFRLFIQRLAMRSKGPLLLAVEDLHLSGDATLDLLHYLSRNLTRAGVLLCATYRTEEAGDRLERFTASLQKEKLSEGLALQPLSSQDVSIMVDLLCPGTGPSPQFRELLYQKTEGNPLFVEELVKLVPGEEVTEGLSALKEVPHSIQAVLKRRVGSLDSGVREILSCAAVVGEEFEFEVLRGALDRPEMEVMEAVEVGARAHIVHESTRGEEERYRFMHALMADVLYSGIGRARRRLWHGRVGEALEEVYAGRLGQLNGQLTYHFELGENWDKALKYALTSAKQAKEAYANREAIRLYEKAREILPRLTRECDDERDATAQGLGGIYRLTGEYEKAHEQYRMMEDIARRTGDGKKEGEALSNRSIVHRLQDQLEEAIACAEMSNDIFEKTDNQKGLGDNLRLIGNVHADRGDFGQALRCYEEALKISREIGDKRTMAQNLNNIGIVHNAQGNYGKATECYEGSLKMFREIGDRFNAANSLSNLGVLLSDRGDYGESLRYKEEALTIYREIGYKRGVAHSLNNIGIVHNAQGNHGKAMECYEESLKVHREIGDSQHAAINLNNIGIVYQKRGDYGESLKYQEASLMIRREIGDKFGIPASLGNIGNVHFNRGDYGEALRCHEEALKVRREIADKKGVASSLTNVGNVHFNRGDYGEALGCLKEALEIYREVDAKRDAALGLQSMGNLYQSLYDIGRAMKCHKRSLVPLEKMGAKTEKANVLMRIGINNHFSGDDDKALQYLNEALRGSADLGLRETETEVLAAFSEVWLAKGDSEKASESCERFVGMAEKMGLKGYLARGKKIRGEILLSRASPKSRILSTKQIQSSKSTIQNDKSRARMLKDAEAASPIRRGGIYDARLRARMLKDAEAELNEAQRIAEGIGARPLLWQIHASLGKVYREQGDMKMASKQFGRAKEIIENIASTVEDEKLRSTFLNSKQIQAVLTA